jgi:hypothetical protein
MVYALAMLEPRPDDAFRHLDSVVMGVPFHVATANGDDLLHGCRRDFSSSADLLRGWCDWPRDYLI